MSPRGRRAALALLHLYGGALGGAGDALDASVLLHAMPGMTYDAGRLLGVAQGCYSDISPAVLQVSGVGWVVCVCVGVRVGVVVLGSVCVYAYIGRAVRGMGACRWVSCCCCCCCCS